MDTDDAHISEILDLLDTGPRKHYYIDESGDVGLFTRGGRKLVGRPTTSHFFMLGMIDAFNDVRLHDSITDLRQTIWSEITNDPRYSSDPSYVRRHRHLEFHFHANDDPPSIRARVFNLLVDESNTFRFSAVVIDRLEYFKSVAAMSEADSTYKYTKNDEYDYLVRLLLRSRLHKEAIYAVMFSKRGPDRSKALLDAIINMRQEMCTRLKIADRHYMVIAGNPEAKEHGALQVVDYCLWALQRLYNRKESEYLDKIWPMVTIVNDRHASGGTGGQHYIGKKPSDLTALKNARGI